MDQSRNGHDSNMSEEDINEELKSVKKQQEILDERYAVIQTELSNVRNGEYSKEKPTKMTALIEKQKKLDPGKKNATRLQKLEFTVYHRTHPNDDFTSYKKRMQENEDNEKQRKLQKEKEDEKAAKDVEKRKNTDKKKAEKNEIKSANDAKKKHYKKTKKRPKMLKNKSIPTTKRWTGVSQKK